VRLTKSRVHAIHGALFISITNATTPVDPRVLDAMLPFLERDFGNPSSQIPRRQSIGTLFARLGSGSRAPSRGPILKSFSRAGDRIDRCSNCVRPPSTVGSQPWPSSASASTEHPQCSAPPATWCRRACVVDYVGVDGPTACCSARGARKVGGKRCAHCVVMAANNETGVNQPYGHVRSICTTYGALFHATQHRSSESCRFRR